MKVYDLEIPDEIPKDGLEVLCGPRILMVLIPDSFKESAVKGEDFLGVMPEHGNGLYYGQILKLKGRGPNAKALVDLREMQSEGIQFLPIMAKQIIDEYILRGEKVPRKLYRDLTKGCKNYRKGQALR